MALEQLLLISSGNYSTLNSLPIGINYICIYLCIAILIFKQYHLLIYFFLEFSLFSWRTHFSKNLGYEFPSLIYFIFIFSKCLIIYADIYMVDVRKFRVNRYALRDNLAICFIYFSFIFLLNTFTNSRYYYGFLSHSTTAIFTFILLLVLCTYLLFYLIEILLYLKKEKSK